MTTLHHLCRTAQEQPTGVTARGTDTACCGGCLLADPFLSWGCCVTQTLCIPLYGFCLTGNTLQTSLPCSTYSDLSCSGCLPALRCLALSALDHPHRRCLSRSVLHNIQKHTGQCCSGLCVSKYAHRACKQWCWCWCGRVRAAKSGDGSCKGVLLATQHQGINHAIRA